jgi:hypothetical protein
MIYTDIYRSFILVSRNGYTALLLISGLLLLSFSIMAALFSGRQPATVSLDVGFSVVRLIVPFIVFFVVQIFFTQEFVRRTYLCTLSYPRSRLTFFMARFFLSLFFSIFALVFLCLVLGLLSDSLAKNYAQYTPIVLDYRYYLVVLFIAVDTMVLTAVACLLAVLAVTPSFVLIGTFGFMLIARSFAEIVALLDQNAGLVRSADTYSSSLGALGYLLPDLGMLDIRAVAIYGRMEFLPADWPGLLLTCFAYVLGLLGTAVWALQRKRFA